MIEGTYGKEPFDLRLTVLRFLRNLDKILIFSLIGTLLFGGCYYIKNVVLGPDTTYGATSTYKVTYVTPPVQSGDYYINEMTWNTLVQSQAFLTAVQDKLTEVSLQKNIAKPELSDEELLAAISAKLPSDWNVPTTMVVTDNPEKTLLIAAAVEAAMTDAMREISAEIQQITVITPALTAAEVELDVRTARAFILGAVLSLLFVTVFFLLKELGDDSIWLPETIRRRYGLKVVGTIHSPELVENVHYLFRGREKLGVCSIDDSIDTIEVVKALEAKHIPVAAPLKEQEWTPVPAPLMCPETCWVLRQMDGMLLVVPAGSHTGKPLEYALAFLSQQDCEIVAAILWDADEKLIDAYYCFSKERRKNRRRK